MPNPHVSRAYALTLNNQINVTPFVDVMLVLLIIFMVAAPLATVSLKLDMPPPCRVDCRRPPDPVIVTIRQGGSLWFSQGARTGSGDAASLRQELTAFIGGPHPNETVVVLRADPTVRYGAFMEVMNGLHTAGYAQVSLLSETL